MLLFEPGEGGGTGALQTMAVGLELRVVRARLDFSITPLTALRVHERKSIHRHSRRRLIIQICCLEGQNPIEADYIVYFRFFRVCPMSI